MAIHCFESGKIGKYAPLGPRGCLGGGGFPNTSLLSAVYYYIADLQGPRSTNLAVMTGAHNWLRGHICLVVIRAFAASQATHAFLGGEIIKFAI